MSNKCISSRCRRGVWSTGGWRLRQTRCGKRRSHSIALAAVALGSHSPGDFISYQKTILESNRIRPGKTSACWEGFDLVFTLRIALAESSVWYLKHVPPRSPLPSRRPQTRVGLPGRWWDESRMLAWLLSHSAGGQSQDCELRLCRLFPDLLPNSMKKWVFLSLSFPTCLQNTCIAF